VLLLRSANIRSKKRKKKNNTYRLNLRIINIICSFPKTKENKRDDQIYDIFSKLYLSYQFPETTDTRGLISALPKNFKLLKGDFSHT